MTDMIDVDGICDEFDHEILKMDGYDDCCVGLVQRYGMEPILCYDLSKVLAKLRKDGMTEEEAIEWWEFNQLGAWVGEGTPCFLSTNQEMNNHDRHD